MGHQLVRFDFPGWPDEADSVWQRVGKPRTNQRLLAEFRRALRAGPIDLFFGYFYTSVVYPETVDLIRRAGVPTVNFSCNNVHQFELVRDIAPRFDACVVPEAAAQHDFLAVGAKPLRIQLAANPRVYRPYPEPRVFDVTFVGQRYADRAQFLSYLRANGVDVRAWGAGWQPAKRLNLAHIKAGLALVEDERFDGLARLVRRRLAQRSLNAPARQIKVMGGAPTRQTEVSGATPTHGASNLMAKQSPRWPPAPDPTLAESVNAPLSVGQSFRSARSDAPDSAMAEQTTPPSGIAPVGGSIGPSDGADARPPDRAEAEPDDSAAAGPPDGANPGALDAANAGPRDGADAGPPGGADAGPRGGADLGAPDAGDPRALYGGDSGALDAAEAGPGDHAVAGARDAVAEAVDTRAFGGPRLLQRDLIRMFSQSRISLGFATAGDSHLGVRRLTHLRLREFEAPMSGALYLTEDQPELAEYFVPGAEVLTYTDHEDLLDKVRYFLGHQEQAERIRRAGLQRARRDHTWQHRFTQLFAELGIRPR